MQPEADDTMSAMSRRFRPALIAFFLRRIRNHSEAEDLTQEGLLRVGCSCYTTADEVDRLVDGVRQVVRQLARRGG